MKQKWTMIVLYLLIFVVLSACGISKESEKIENSDNNQVEEIESKKDLESEHIDKLNKGIALLDEGVKSGRYGIKASNATINKDNNVQITVLVKNVQLNESINTSELIFYLESDTEIYKGSFVPVDLSGGEETSFDVIFDVDTNTLENQFKFYYESTVEPDSDSVKWLIKDLT